MTKIVLFNQKKTCQSKNQLKQKINLTELIISAPTQKVVDLQDKEAC